MSDRDKYHRYALIALAIAAASICVISLVSVGERYLSYRYSSLGSDYRGDDLEIKAIVDAINDFDPLQDSIAQWTMALFAILATFVSGAAIYYLRKTLMETRIIGQAQVRAYLAFNIERVEVSQIGFEQSSHSKVSFIGSLVNTGQSPAFMVRTLVNVSIASNDYGRWVSVDGSDFPAGEPVAIPIAAGAKISHMIDEKVNASKQEVLSGASQIRITYLLKYTDVFGVDCASFICSGVIKPSRGAGKMAFVADPVRGVMGMR